MCLRLFAHTIRRCIISFSLILLCSTLRSFFFRIRSDARLSLGMEKDSSSIYLPRSHFRSTRLENLFIFFCHFPAELISHIPHTTWTLHLECINASNKPMLKSFHSLNVQMIIMRRFSVARPLTRHLIFDFALDFSHDAGRKWVWKNEKWNIALNGDIRQYSHQTMDASVLLFSFQTTTVAFSLCSFSYGGEPSVRQNVFRKKLIFIFGSFAHRLCRRMHHWSSSSSSPLKCEIPNKIISRHRDDGVFIVRSPIVRFERQAILVYLYAD